MRRLETSLVYLRGQDPLKNRSEILLPRLRDQNDNLNALKKCEGKARYNFDVDRERILLGRVTCAISEHDRHVESRNHLCE